MQWINPKVNSNSKLTFVSNIIEYRYGEQHANYFPSLNKDQLKKLFFTIIHINVIKRAINFSIPLILRKNKLR